MTQTITDPSEPSDLDLPLDAAPTPVWEQIGTDLSSARTGDVALRLAGLDWTVEQWPVQATDPESWKTTPLPDHRANVRADNRQLLGVVSKTYRVFQNRQLFEFLDTLVADGLVHFHAAGSLRGGRRVWVLCRLPREYVAGAGDSVKGFLLLTNSHDGEGPLQMIPATVRDVCGNCFNLGIGGRLGLSVRHHPGLGQGLAEARRNLQLIAGRFERFKGELAALAQTPLPRPHDYFDGVLAGVDVENKDRLLDRLEANFHSPGNAIPAVAGTAWAAFNAVSEWADHQRTFRGKDDQSRAEARLEGIWFGSSHRIKQAAYRAALDLAGLN